MKNNARFWTVGGALTLLLSGLAFVALPVRAQEPAPKTAEASAPKAAPSWHYDHLEGWAVLGNKEFQSPIKLAVGGGTAKRPGAYANQAVKNIENNGHTIQVNYETKGGELSVDGKPYGLAQFHFHSPSEHERTGYAGWKDAMDMVHPGHYAMEVHFVHSDGSFHGDSSTAPERNDLAVVGVFIKQGTKNAALENIWSKLEDGMKAGTKVPLAAGFDASSLMPMNGAYQTYSGSLTTPPCSSGVTWIVMDEPIEASAGQIAKFRKLMHDSNTNRPVQLPYARVPQAVPGP